MTLTMTEADELALLRAFVGHEVVQEWQAAGADTPGVQEAAAGETESHVEMAWRAIDAAELRGETMAEEAIDAVIAEAEERDAAGVPLTVEAVREYRTGGGSGSGDGEAAKLFAELGIVESAEDALSIHGVTKTED